MADGSKQVNIFYLEIAVFAIPFQGNALIGRYGNHAKETLLRAQIPILRQAQRHPNTVNPCLPNIRSLAFINARCYNCF
jgi:hypothetical protein